LPSTIFTVYEMFFESSTKMIETVRKKISQEEFDYQTLLVARRDYAHPRDKISDLLNKGIIIRVKKGLYVFGDGARQTPYSTEVLANLIYGPSYISLDYALQHYALIPERVDGVTSLTTGRSRKFLGDYLERNLLVDLAAVREMNPDHLDAIAGRYRSQKIRALGRLVRRMRRSLGEKKSCYSLMRLKAPMTMAISRQRWSFSPPP